MSIEKTALRKEFLTKRDALTDSERIDKSQAIIQLMSSLDCVKESKNVLIYVDYSSEVMTKDFIRYMLDNSDKRVFVPLVEGDDINFYEIDTLTDLEFGYKNILEPILHEGTMVYNGELQNNTVVLCPGVAFDKQGNRFGYGKGYYDKFLNKYDKVTKIGLAYACQMSDDELPIEDYDVKMDYVITEERMYFI